MPQSLPLSSVRVTDPYWSAWQDKLVAVTLPHIREQMQNTGRIANFERVAKGEKGGFEGE